MDACVSLVVARAENGVIGRAGGIPWKVPTDLKRFRRITMGRPVIMGRKTYDSIGRPLDGRDNIVVTRRADMAAEGIHVAFSVEEAVRLARRFAGQRGVDEIMVIGGGEIYNAVMPVAGRIYLTEIHASVEGDTYFEAPDPALWREVSREALERSDKDSAAATLVVYERKPAP